jgi:hypothetical protein
VRFRVVGQACHQWLDSMRQAEKAPSGTKIKGEWGCGGRDGQDTIGPSSSGGHSAPLWQMGLTGGKLELSSLDSELPAGVSVRISRVQPGEEAMRDIRNDLLERANLTQDRIKAADVHFERMVERLRNEHDASVADLKAGLAMIAKLMEFEERHIANMSPDTPPPSSQHADLAQKLRRVV